MNMVTIVKSYVPILRWRPAEMTALEKLFPADRDNITPLVEFIMPPPTTDKKDRKKIIDSSKTKFLRRLSEVPKYILRFCGRTPVFVDVHLLDGDIRASSLERILASSRDFDIFSVPVTYIIPVTSTSADTITREVAVNYAKSSGRGLCIRIDRSHLAEENLSRHITEFIAANKLDIANSDLLVDLQIIEKNTDPKVIARQLALLPDIKKWRTFIVTGGAFPKDLTELGVFETHPLERMDWKLWREIINDTGLPRKPIFSDYTIQHPIFYGYVPGANVSASVRYTDDEVWQVFRGQAIGYVNRKTRQKGPGHKQYLSHARTLIDQPFYKGESYSFGDTEIKRIADPKNEKTGNPQKWLSIGINHHLTLVARQTSSLPENSGEFHLRAS